MYFHRVNVLTSDSTLLLMSMCIFISIVNGTLPNVEMNLQVMTHGQCYKGSPLLVTECQIPQLQDYGRLKGLIDHSAFCSFKGHFKALLKGISGADLECV